MELLGWLNAGSLITQNAAAAAVGLPSIDDGEEEEEYEDEEEDENEKPANRLQVQQPLRAKKVKKRYVTAGFVKRRIFSRLAARRRRGGGRRGTKSANRVA